MLTQSCVTIVMLFTLTKKAWFLGLQGKIPGLEIARVFLGNFGLFFFHYVLEKNIILAP